MNPTPWFPARVKPVRDGYYDWRCAKLIQYPFPTDRQEWTRADGWTRIVPCPRCEWRGLAQPSERREG